MGLLSKIFSNTRRPEGFWGRTMVAGMNGGSHALMASWEARWMALKGSAILVGKK